MRFTFLRGMNDWQYNNVVLDDDIICFTDSSTLCLKKTSPMFLAITRESIVGFS